MRMDSIVSFYSATGRKYNPHTHQYEGETKMVVELPANVTDVGTDRSVQVLGNLNANSKVVRTYEEPPAKWDYLLIDGHVTHYRLQTQRKPLKLFTLIVGEDNGGTKS
ncbi:hypothetical protein H5971_02965 [Lactobacillus coleohominis]|nr:hypothetical protein [Limosilactobacillus coleohominis]